MGRVIVISSGKGGVGKTTITANLGIYFAKMKKSVCLIDGDFGLNNLDCLLGLENRVVYDILDILRGDCRIRQGLVKDPIYSNLYMLASTKLESNKCVSIKDSRDLVLELEQVFDYVLIDSPAGLDFGYARAISPAGEMLVVVTPTLASVRDAVKCIQQAKSMGDITTSVVVNRVKWNLVALGEMLNIRDIEEITDSRVVGIIPENSQLCVGNNLKNLFHIEKVVCDAFCGLAENVENHTAKIVDGTKKFKGILGGYFLYKMALF